MTSSKPTAPAEPSRSPVIRPSPSPPAAEPSTGTYTLLTADGGISGPVPTTVNLPAGWTADAPQIVGNDLQINITSTGGGASPYDTWIAGFDFSAYTSPDLTATGNPDGDAFTNLQEFAFGFDPAVSDGGAALSISGGSITQDGPPQIYEDPVTHQFFLRYTRRTDYVAAGLDLHLAIRSRLAGFRRLRGRDGRQCDCHRHRCRRGGHRGGVHRVPGRPAGQRQEGALRPGRGDPNALIRP